jgi:butyryl-CoA dehydrogenase
VTTIQDKLLPTLQFLVLDWLRAAELTSRPRYADHDADTFSLILESAAEIAGDVFEKASRVSDDEEPLIVDGHVALPDATYAAWRAYVDAGFLSLAQDAERGGQQLPRLVELASKVPIISAAGSLLPAMLTEAAAGLLLVHGNDAQKDVFATNLLAGRWAGTMCLSEPQAGSSLADITTRARPDGHGYAEDPLGPRHRISGHKMWISGGEHELTDNIVHLVLAKTVGPDGDVDPTTKGISLFVVPRFLISQDGAPREPNDVTLVGLNHKLGSRGLPNTALAFGAGDHRPQGGSGAIGYLVGEPGDGLRQMFHMMNAARIRIGLLSAATGFAGYAESLAYARERKQGRPRSTGAKGQWSPQVPIIEHADVRRMLLAQKSYCEGALALGLYAARLLDEEQTGGPADAQEATQLLSILTPIVKSWPSEWCLVPATPATSWWRSTGATTGST